MVEGHEGDQNKEPGANLLNLGSADRIREAHDHGWGKNGIFSFFTRLQLDISLDYKYRQQISNMSSTCNFATNRNHKYLHITL